MRRRAPAAGLSRRGFLRSAAVAAAGAVAPRSAWAEEPLYPPMDLSIFDRPITPLPFALQLGYAAITWDGDDERAIEEISSLGFKAVQLRANVLDRWGGKPEDLRRRLEEKGLRPVCFSSGSLDAVPEREDEHFRTHLEHARFVKAIGGRFLQVLSRRPEGRAPTPVEFERLGRLLTRIGRRVLDEGLRLVYHNHMNAFGEAPEEVARILDVTDRHFVDLLLDIAHYRQGGGDPVAAVTRHKDRLAVLHLKDVVSPLPDDERPARQSYRFVELGRGQVDVPGVIAALKGISFRGPALIELDRPPVPERTPKECAALNKQYVQQILGLPL